MKKQKKINKLAFTKAAVTELNDASLQNINGGSRDLLSLIIETFGFSTWLHVV